MADILYDALKPYVGAGWLNQQASGLNDYGWRNYTAIAGNRASFDPAESLNLMKTYNQTYGLGLTDAEIADGIKKFGDWHVNQFGGGLAADSSIPAVAAQSLAEALTLKGENGYASPFWQDVSKPGGVLQLGNEAAIKKGQEALAAIDTDWNNNLAVFGSGMSNGIGYDNSSGFQDFMMSAIPAAMAAVVAPAIAGEFASGLGGLGAAGESAAAATTVANPGSIAAQWAALEGTPTLVMGGDLAAGGLGAFASEAGFGGLEAAATGLETGYGPNGDLTLEEFLTSPDSVTGLEGFGGSQGIPAMDTLGSTSWLESAVNSLKHGDTSWLTSSISPTQIKSVLSKAFGGGSAPTRTGATKTAAGAGGMGGINIFNTGGDESGLADAMKIFSGGRSGMDSVVQAMSQSGKGN